MLDGHLKEKESESQLRAREEEVQCLREREKTLTAHIYDLEKAYAIAMDMAKTAQKETLVAVGAAFRPLALQDDYPNTRDLVVAILSRTGSLPDR
jgi:hypothetical protein